MRLISKSELQSSLKPASKASWPTPLRVSQTSSMNFAKRIQILLRRPKRDSESSEANSTMEIKEAPETGIPRLEVVSSPAVLFSDMNDGAISSVYQMEPQPMEEDRHPMFVIEHPPTPPPKIEAEIEEDEDEDAPIPLAPKIIVDPNLPSILNAPVERRSPTKAHKKEGSSPQTIRFELAGPPERSNPNYKRLSAVSSSPWRLLPFNPPSNGGNALPRPNNSTASSQDGDTLGMTQRDGTTNPFLGTWLGAGFPANLLMEADATKELQPFLEEEVRSFC